MNALKINAHELKCTCHNQMGGKIVVVGFFFFLTLVLSHILHVPYLNVIRETFEK